MEFQDVLRRRRMVRNFDSRPLARDVVERIVANGLRAPSAGFTQGWAFLVLEGTEETSRFWSATFASAEARAGFRWQGLFNAPLLIVALSHKDAYLDRYAEDDKGWADRSEDRWPVPYWYVDTGMASLLILQTAVDEGLGACFFGIPGEHTDGFRAAFGIPADHVPVGAITVGHRLADSGAKGSPARRGRRTNLVHRGRWGTTVGV